MTETTEHVDRDVPRDRSETSETTGKFAKALAAAQCEMENATLNKVNPHFKNKYSDLPTIRNATVPMLAKHEIATTQTYGVRDGRDVIITTLTHSSGEWVSSAYPIIADKAGPQPFMAGATYARRGSLSAIACISADEDDDGNAAQKGVGNGQLASHAPISPEQKKLIIAEIRKTSADTTKFLKYLNCESLDVLAASRFGQAMNALAEMADRRLETGKKETADGD